jgi:hypothetical protein
MQLSKSLLLFSLIIIVFSGFNNSANQDCEKYRTGKFYIYNKLNKQRINIERKDSLQIETNELTGDMTISKVKWTSACDYELFFNYMTPKEVSKDTTVKRVFDANSDTPLQIKILSGTDSYYVFEASKQGFQSLRDTVWLLK